MMNGLHHVGLVSSDASRTAAFYGGLLGLRQLWDEGVAGESVLGFGDADGTPGSLVVFDVRPGKGRGRPGIGGLHHLALGVADEAVLLRWKRRLVDAGVPVAGPYDRGYFTSLYFPDPDGQVVELATAGPGYAVDEAESELGTRLTVPPRRIVRGFRDERVIAALTHPDPVPGITPDMVLDGLHHVSGITDDLGAAGTLLEQGLGLRLVKQTTNRDDPSQLHFFWAAMAGGTVAPRSAYTLFGWPSGWNRARAGAGQAVRVGFRVVDEAALETWRGRLADAGIEASSILAGPRWSSVRFRTHDGMALELAVDGTAFR
jgi:glyoxalase family protein